MRLIPLAMVAGFTALALVNSFWVLAIVFYPSTAWLATIIAFFLLAGPLAVARGLAKAVQVLWRRNRPAAAPLAPGAGWTGEFLADRPGEDFAWLLDGEPAGRLTVTGSHLVEGHR